MNFFYLLIKKKSDIWRERHYPILTLWEIATQSELRKDVAIFDSVSLTWVCGIQRSTTTSYSEGASAEEP